MLPHPSLPITSSVSGPQASHIASSVSLGSLPDTTLVALGRHITTVGDLDHFERVAGRPIPGLYPALFEGELYIALVQPIHYLKVTTQESTPLPPDASMRYIVRDEGAPTFADAWVINSRPITCWQDVDNDNFIFWRSIANKSQFSHLPVVKSIRRESERRDRYSLNQDISRTPMLIEEIWDYMARSSEDQAVMRQRGALRTTLVSLKQHLAQLEIDTADFSTRHGWPQEVVQAAQGLSLLLPPLEMRLFEGHDADDIGEASDTISLAAARIGHALDASEKRGNWFWGT